MTNDDQHEDEDVQVPPVLTPVPTVKTTLPPPPEWDGPQYDEAAPDVIEDDGPVKIIVPHG